MLQSKIQWLNLAMFLTSFLSTSLSSLFSQRVLADVPLEHTPQIDVLTINVDVPVCYMTTVNGSTIDLTEICRDNINRSENQAAAYRTSIPVSSNISPDISPNIDPDGNLEIQSNSRFENDQSK